MPKYLQLAKITFEEYFVYRLNFVLWRFRSFVFFLTLFFFWLAIYGNRTEFLGYQKSQMLAYVVGIAFLRSIVLGSRSVDLTGQIRTGELTKIVLSPINIFSFWLTRDLPDKLLNIFFTIIEIGVVLAVFKFPFYLPHQASSILAFLVIASLAIFLYFFLSMALAITAFWTEEIWVTRWLFGIIFLEFFAGAFFPIDVLPPRLTRVIYLTPFPYLVFFPLKIWLEQLSTVMILKAILICSGWLVFFYWLAHFLWQKGAKNYGAYGG
jgi:ABC-2 type transport system permease protein